MLKLSKVTKTSAQAKKKYMDIFEQRSIENAPRSERISALIEVGDDLLEVGQYSLSCYPFQLAVAFIREYKAEDPQNEQLMQDIKIRLVNLLETRASFARNLE